MELDYQDGQLVEVVKTTRVVELQELNDKVTVAEAALAEVSARKAAHDEQGAALEAEVSAAQKAVDDSKSAVTRGEELVATASTAGVDAGTVDTGSEATATVETAATEIPVNVAPSENLF